MIVDLFIIDVPFGWNWIDPLIFHLKNISIFVDFGCFNINCIEEIRVYSAYDIGTAGLFPVLIIIIIFFFCLLLSLAKYQKAYHSIMHLHTNESNMMIKTVMLATVAIMRNEQSSWANRNSFFFFFISFHSSRS